MYATPDGNRKEGKQLSLLEDVKNELALIDDDPPIVKRAQAATMIRFAGAMGVVKRHVILECSFDNLASATWLVNTIKNVYGQEALVLKRTVKTSKGVVSRYMVRVLKNTVNLAIQTGLIDRRTKHRVVGLPAEVVGGSPADIKAAWRGAFLAHGMLSEPGRASCLDIACPNKETAMALQGTARRLGFATKTKVTSEASTHIVIRDSDAVERILLLMGAIRTSREWSGKRVDGESRGKANRLANFDDANMRRSAKAAVEASKKITEAFEILGDDIPQNLRDAGRLRLEHRDASLEQLGQLADPPVTKDAIAGRIRRLLQLAERAKKQREAEGNPVGIGGADADDSAHAPHGTETSDGTASTGTDAR